MATATTTLGLTALTTVLSDDVVVIVDVHDATQSPAGSTKKITVANLFAPYLPLAGGVLAGPLTVGHVISSGSAPTQSGGNSIAGTDLAGTVSVTGTGGNVGVAVTFASAYSVAPQAILTSPASATAAGTGTYVNTITTTGFTLWSALGNGVTGSFHYLVIG